MALNEDQIKAVRTQVDLASGGDKHALVFFEGLKRQAAAKTDLHSQDMLDLADEIMAERGMTGFGTPLVGINLSHDQIRAARDTIAKAEAGDAHALQFWAGLEAQALKGEGASLQYLKARDQIRKENLLAAQALSGMGVQAPALAAAAYPTHTAAGVPLPVPPPQFTAVVAVAPVAAVGIGAGPELQTLLTEARKYRDEVKDALDEAIKAYKQILELKEAVSLVFASPSVPQPVKPTVGNGG